MQTTIPIIYSCVLYLSYFASRVSFRLLFCFASLSPRSIFRSLSFDLELDAFPPGGIRTRQDQSSTIFEYESTCNFKVHYVICQSRHFASLELRSSEFFRCYLLLIFSLWPPPPTEQMPKAKRPETPAGRS